MTWFRACWRELATIAVAVGLVATLSTPFAYAAEAAKAKMSFQVVRNSDVSCEPLCTEWIAAAGVIDSSSPARLKKLLARLGKQRLPIIVTSNGGNPVAALEMGRLIRHYGLDIGVGDTVVVPCLPEVRKCPKVPYVKGYTTSSMANCDSACAYMLAGGVNRQISSSNFIGVHLGTPRKAMRQFRPNLERYVEEMGVSKDLVEKAFATTELVNLSIGEMTGYRLLTDTGGSEYLTSPKICGSYPVPANCAKRSSDGILIPDAD